MKSEIKTGLLFGVAIVAALGILGVVFSTLDEQTPSTFVSTDEQGITKIDKSGFKKAPELTGIADYLNITAEELENEIDGKVVLYDIWTYSCINCIRTLPFITAWDDKYADQGLLIIGVHSPEFEFEKDIENVKLAASKHGINYPVVLDNDKETWKAFENNYWPRKYIADHEGYIRYDHIGEGGYRETEKVIQDLLKERANAFGMQAAAAKNLVEIDEFEHSWLRSPELYFGYYFAQNRNQLGNDEGFRPNQDVTYSIPDSHQRHYFYVDGTWTNLKGSMKLVSDSGKILLPYSGKEVNIVTAGEAILRIHVDGMSIDPSIAGNDVQNHGVLHVEEPGLYNIVQTEASEDHTIEIFVDEPGFEIFTFTFG
ncbi:MAG: redoxin domain-containing protein [Nitrosopumilus sp.]|nr:MAG: redoxin domain-containing protein [Nitrosopumilus sp.]